MKRITILMAAIMALSAATAYAAAPQPPKKTCNAEAAKKNLKGDDRKAFMSECLAKKPAKTAEPALRPPAKDKPAPAIPVPVPTPGTDPITPAR